MSAVTTSTSNITAQDRLARTSSTGTSSTGTSSTGTSSTGTSSTGTSSTGTSSTGTSSTGTSSTGTSSAETSSTKEPATKEPECKTEGDRMVRDFFRGGDRSSYQSVFRREGILSGNEKQDEAYMTAHETNVWSNIRRAQDADLEQFNRSTLLKSKLSDAGLDSDSIGFASVAADQRDSSQVGLRVLAGIRA